jgi:hypothetical protein
MTPIPPWMSRSIAAAVLAAGAAGVALELARVNSPARTPLVVLFLVAAPALAVAGLMRGIDAFARLIIGATAAIVINSLVAVVMLAAGVWSPRAGLLAVAAISVAGLTVQLSPVGTRLAGSRPGEAGEPEPGAGGHDLAAPAPAGDAAPSQRGAFRGRRRKGARQAAVTDEATVQMSAVQAPAARPPAAPPPAARTQPARQESPGDDAATVQMPAFSRDRPAASHGGSYAHATGAPPGPAPAPTGREDHPPSGDDSTLQFPTIGRDG